MKVTLVFLIVCCSIQVLAQGNLHVKGKIRSDSLANQNYLIIYADSTGTLDTLPAGLPGQVLISNGQGQKPTWTTIPSSVFNPLYPDGTDSLISVNEYLNSTQSYIVPNGKNLHLINFVVEHFISPSSPYSLYVNGNAASIGPFPMVLGAGTVISTNITSVDSAWVIGYLATPVVIPVIPDLTGNPYTVPIGKTLFITNIRPSGPLTTGTRVFLNGKKTAAHDLGLWNKIPIVANPGDVFSTDNVNPSGKVIIYGYLR